MDRSHFIRSALLLALASASAAEPTLTCPEPTVVECDGSGNAADRAAWLGAFAANGACPPIRTLLETRPGVVLESTGGDTLCDLSRLQINGDTVGITNPILVDDHCGIRITDQLWQTGSFFLVDPLDLSADASFSTHFAFHIPNPLGTCLDLDGRPGADGIVFVLQSVSNTAGGLGGEIGYGGLSQSVGVELDTWENRTVDDGDTNHIGINLDGDMDSVVQQHVVPDFNDGGIWHCWIDYDGATDLLEARVAKSALRPAAANVSWIVDVPTLLGSTTVYPGFTSGTGCAGGWHEVLDWTFDVVLGPEPCPVLDVETATFTAEDSCGHWDTCRSTFRIEDRVAADITTPVLADCYETLADAVAEATAGSSAFDACDGALPITIGATGGCNAQITVSAVDACGNLGTRTLLTTVDALPPVITSPADFTVECDQPLVLAPASCADECDPSPSLVETETRTPGPCGNAQDIARSWEAVDACGHMTTARQVIHVVDTTPPVIEVGPAAEACLWPPNHWMVCFTRADWAPIVRDACGGAVSWSFVGCASDQPEDDLGDGHFAPDCVIAPDGSGFCVRAERQGTVPAGRHYGVAIVAVDACGNATPPTVIGNVYVPHDQSPHESCLKTTVVGIKHHEPLPF